jgi:hypothetical protein
MPYLRLYEKCGCILNNQTVVIQHKIENIHKYYAVFVLILQNAVARDNKFLKTVAEAKQ